MVARPSLAASALACTLTGCFNPPQTDDTAATSGPTLVDITAMDCKLAAADCEGVRACTPAPSTFEADCGKTWHALLRRPHKGYFWLRDAGNGSRSVPRP